MNDGGTDRVPVELLVRIEPPVTGSRGEPAQPDRVEFATEPTGAGRPVRGGGSFNEATTLPGSGRYGETIQYGEELFYRVKLGWGEGMATRVTFVGVPDVPTENVKLYVFNPVRAELDMDSTGYTGSTTTLPTNGEPIATTRVMYLNRNHGDVANQQTGIDGWYYIMVKLGSASAGSGGVPVKIDVAVAGTKVSGPEYGSRGTTEPTPTTTPTEVASPSETPSGTAGTPVDEQPAEEDSGSALPWVIGGAAAVLALAIVATAVILRRRRQSGPAGHGPPN